MPRVIGVVHDLVSSNGHAAVREHGAPAGSRAYRAGGVEESYCFLARGEACEAVAGGIVRADEELLSM